MVFCALHFQVSSSKSAKSAVYHTDAMGFDIKSSPFISELFKFPLSSSSSAFSVSLWFFYHSGVTGFDIIPFSATPDF